MDNSENQSDDLENQPKCFVIQTFDDGMYDRRYNESIKPALLKAKVTPRRADEILGPKPIIEKIENAIRESDICLAEISSDNPNVWLEVGYAYSLQKPTLLLCDMNIRKTLPFDIQHRPVIFYTAQYKSGFEDLEKKIVREIGEFLKQSKNLIAKEPIALIPTNSIGALTIEAQLLLYMLMESHITDPNGMSGWQIQNNWHEYNLDKHKIPFAIAILAENNFINPKIKTDYDGNDYTEYTLTPSAITWITAHPELYEVVANLSKKNPSKNSTKKLLDDEIPF